MPPALLQSQLSTLETPQRALTLDIADAAEALVEQICSAFFE
jgi:gluconate kinase